MLVAMRMEGASLREEGWEGRSEDLVARMFLYNFYRAPFQRQCAPVWKTSYVITHPRTEGWGDLGFIGGQRKNPLEN